jgi:hypothetical protein
MLIRNHKLFTNQKGTAVLELIPTLVVFMLLINFSLGFFGIIHTGILNNIAARNYFFETLRHRSNLTYHRLTPADDSGQVPFKKRGYRYSGIVSERSTLSEAWIATSRPLAFTSGFGGSGGSQGVDLSSRGPANEANAVDVHNKQISQMNEAARNDRVSVSQVWLKQIYGICLNSKCGD